MQIRSITLQSGIPELLSASLHVERACRTCSARGELRPFTVLHTVCLCMHACLSLMEGLKQSLPDPLLYVLWFLREPRLTARSGSSLFGSLHFLCLPDEWRLLGTTTLLSLQRRYPASCFWISLRGPFPASSGAQEGAGGDCTPAHPTVAPACCAALRKAVLEVGVGPRREGWEGMARDASDIQGLDTHGKGGARLAAPHREGLGR